MHEILYNAGLSVTFGVVGIILLIFGYCVFDKVLTKIDFTEELKNKNIAVAIVIAGFMIAIGVIISGVVS
ncbi:MULTISPECIES: DUF350 domain-containing protein [Clostridium]|uniref:DUF350 domain-containing protein n=1 Tax=Clostridium botulinum (strain Eklund 17B / Type B) TaxID=935198 RepID=B2TN35_CLOBB|nr:MULTISPECIES: DUF350 domain-containing protein [Clostridium]ACD24482.1 conserved hypothetical protein [Clostridium botulinum B str. Eklund 17B (NRP)]MBN1044696.1 DUF350 domain-containing protein [Clostridium botulinum]MBN1051426.1 DUF350 domain-containing protein [Clostridium botulinum]MBY6975105.1 DUF350 domain-containing protein [Clostridium botulinum]MBY7000086.1 DUF350 domain-containing protein [Clostridium botulinum]